MPRKRLDAKIYIEGILNKDKILLSQAITLVESKLESDKELSKKIIEEILPFTGKSKRIGITGVPGVGKSTFIESFGELLTQKQKSVAVLSIDPSSQVTKGSILGDKTRMENLSKNPLAYIRPSPAGSVLGGVSHKTREVILLCEAAGFDVIIVETVGVGQSETDIKEITDFFLLLMLAGAGDELQGIKKGIMEMADAIVITKSDGNNKKEAKIAAHNYQNALHLSHAHNSHWNTQVLTCSALTKEGIAEVWEMIEAYYEIMKGSLVENLRNNQNVTWMTNWIDTIWKDNFYQNKLIIKELISIKEKIISKQTSPPEAALELFTFWKNLLKNEDIHKNR